MLINIIKLNRKYNLKIKGMLHIGAHECEELRDYLKLKIKNVVWIEAMKDKVNFIKNKYPNLQIINAVISDKDDEKVTFNITNNGQSSSILELGTHKQEHPHIFVTKKEEYTTQKLSTVIKKNNIDMENINFLNLDIQGVELRALKGLEEYINKVDYIYTEVNEKELYIGCDLISDIDIYLEKFGFQRVETSMTKHGWGDAFYVKS